MTGYTTGNLDGAHAGNTTDDAFAVQYDAAGNQRWIRQFGVPGVAGFITRYSVDGDAVWLKQFGTSASDEAWGLAADPAGGVYLTGYTAGDFSGALAGDKDIIVARVDGDGVLTWRDQLGTTGNDKGAAVAVDGSGNVYVAGFTDGAVETSIGKFDGVVTKYSPETHPHLDPSVRYDE
ncbi:SBBP repeat-containing protein [Kribbella steppae]|uniref:SBBP repeat-containing protein n=1 Tax=Kribbella steppae TaxID=2512223 RepID=UPI00130DF992|nr:SBBP repeat-containing protein [Kribbella steppae]